MLTFQRVTFQIIMVSSDGKYSLKIQQSLTILPTMKQEVFFSLLSRSCLENSLSAYYKAELN